MKRFFLSCFCCSYPFLVILFLLICCNSFQSLSQTITVSPSADAFVKNGNASNTKYGNETDLLVKGSPTIGFTRFTYLKFSLPAISKAGSAKLRLYGVNKDDAADVSISVFGVDDDAWTESAITFNNAPKVATGLLASASVNNTAAYYEFDITSFVLANLNTDKVASVVLKDISNKDKTISFDSRETTANPPQLVIDTTFEYVPGATISHPFLFVENPDKFPSNNHFVFSRIQNPWTRDSIYNSNHDSLKIIIHNNGLDPLLVSSLSVSDPAIFKIDKVNGSDYDPAIQFPAIISSGSSLDVIVKFIAKNLASRVLVVSETLTIHSNDEKFPVKTISLDGLWQRDGEGVREPTLQEIITTFGFKTNIGFAASDPDEGDSAKLKGDEINPGYFVRTDPSKPVLIRQLAAYHNCCQSVETFKWFYKGTTNYQSAFQQISFDGQTLLPRRSKSATYYPAGGTISPTDAFGINIGGSFTDASKNSGNKLGVRVYLAIDSLGNVIPDAFILANDYVGNSSTNFDYNDNVYFINNVKPYIGTAYYSLLQSTPSDLDFGENELNTATSMQLNLKSGGKAYSNGTIDPEFTITSFKIVGENGSEFSTSIPAKSTLSPQETTTMTVDFKPASQGLKIADLLIYYTNSSVPVRIPLYGIAKRKGVVVTSHYRINSGSPSSVNVNGKTFAADNQYAFDNLEPYINGAVKNIEGTDDDDLYFYEQSSNANKKPFRYALPLDSGNYYVRLHFAEVYWGAPGSGFSGGEGSRVFHVKLENQHALINTDLVQEVGVATAVIKNLPVTVTDGMLNMDFTATVNRPSVSAIEVLSFSKDPVVVPGDSTINPVDTLSKIKVYPNPATVYGVTVEYPANYTGIYNYVLFDVIGRKYLQGNITLTGGNNNIQYLDYSGLQLRPGVYFLKIISPAYENDLLKILVNQR